MPDIEREADTSGKEENKAAQDYDVSHEDQLHVSLFVCMSVVPFILCLINHFISDFHSINNVTCLSGAIRHGKRTHKAARVEIKILPQEPTTRVRSLTQWKQLKLITKCQLSLCQCQEVCQMFAKSCLIVLSLSTTQKRDVMCSSHSVLRFYLKCRQL